MDACLQRINEGSLLTKPPVGYGPSQGTVKVLLTALGNTLQDGRMGTGTCQWQGNSNIVFSVTLQGKLFYCVHWTALLQIMRL